MEGIVAAALMKNAYSTKKTANQHDWENFDTMTETQYHAAALTDPDAQPITSDNIRRMKRTPQVKIIRRALGLSQEDFAAGRELGSVNWGLPLICEFVKLMRKSQFKV